MPYLVFSELEQLLRTKQESSSLFDFIVVGAGSAGCPLASRLSEDPSVSVLLVEAGGNLSTIGQTKHQLNHAIPANVSLLQHDPLIDWEYYAAPQYPRACTHLHTFQSATAAQKTKLHQSFWPRGKGMGGSSSVNYLMYCRGHVNDYNEWESKYGAKGWSWKTIGPLFDQRIENTTECDPHRLCSKCRTKGGGGGPLGVSHKKPPSPLVLAFLSSVQAAVLGCKERDYNCCCSSSSSSPSLLSTSESNNGVVGLHQQTVRQGTRCDTARAYIDPLMQHAGSRPNLWVVTGAKCQSIVTEQGQQNGVVVAAAHGVVLVAETPSRSDTTDAALKVLCQKEVILSAGALASPQILMQSGIGPNGAVVDSPQVGQHLQDHMVSYLHFRAAKPNQDIGAVTAEKAGATSMWTALYNKVELFLFHRGVLSSTAYDASIFFSSDENATLPYPDLQVSALCAHTNKDLYQANIGIDLDAFELTDEDSTPNAQGMVLCCTLLHPKSLGHVTMNDKKDDKSNNGSTIYANYWSDVENSDVQRMTTALRTGYRIANAGPLQHLLAKAPILPRDLLQKFNLPLEPTSVDQIPDAFWDEYIRRYGTTLYHPVGTCRLGTSKETGVVDHKLRVFGVNRLRVADASIQPEIVSGNTNASCIVIGERAADIIREDYGLKSNDPESLNKAVARYERSIQRKRWIIATLLGGTATAAAAGLVASVATLVLNRSAPRSRTI